MLIILLERFQETYLSKSIKTIRAKVACLLLARKVSQPTPVGPHEEVLRVAESL
jgi:hypothetical protein